MEWSKIKLREAINILSVMQISFKWYWIWYTLQLSIPRFLNLLGFKIHLKKISSLWNSSQKQSVLSMMKWFLSSQLMVKMIWMYSAHLTIKRCLSMTIYWSIFKLEKLTFLKKFGFHKLQVKAMNNNQFFK